MGKNKPSQSQQKERRDGPPNPNSIPNRETFQRMNFLYQASAYLNNVGALCRGRQADDAIGAGETTTLSSGSSASTNEEKPKGNGNRKKATVDDLGAGYINDLRTIGNKNVLRIDPAVKRKLCKGCNTVFMPGITASVRIKSTRSRASKKVVYTCLRCQSSRSIPVAPSRPSSMVQGDMECDMVTTSHSTVSPVETGDSSLETTLHAVGISNPSDATVGIGAGSSRKTLWKDQRRRRQVKHKVPLLSERRDAGHMVIKGNEVQPFE